MLALFARINTAPTFGFKPLGDFGLTSGTNPTVFLNEYSYKKGTKIYGEKEPADYVYQVKIGAVRSYKLLSDGRRQIGAFHLIGDIFGLENGSEHRFTAEAIVNTTVRLIKRRNIADYLGLTLETVSRALSRLHELDIIGFIGSNQRQIVLLDRRQLASLD